MSRRRQQLARAVLAATLMLLVGPLSAHQLKESMTRVLFNARSGNIEVMHRFLLHDAEHATSKLFPGEADLLKNAADRDRFGQYARERFSLVDQDGRALDLSPVGTEIDGAYLWVYSETPIPKALTAITISHEALRDVWPEQVNRVNVERGETVQSATFDKSQRATTILF
ncbi:MAG: DUF6702 family protein [Acidobacteriota bacterium]